MITIEQLLKMEYGGSQRARPIYTCKTQCIFDKGHALVSLQTEFVITWTIDNMVGFMLAMDKQSNRIL